MATSYPNSIQRFPNTLPPLKSDAPTETTLLHQLFDTLEAVQDQLGTIPSGNFSSVKSWLSSLSSGQAISSLSMSKLVGNAINSSTTLTLTAPSFFVRGELRTFGDIMALSTNTASGTIAGRWLRTNSEAGENLYPAFTVRRYSGTTNSSGVSRVPHGISNGTNYLLAACFFWKGESGEKVLVTDFRMDVTWMHVWSPLPSRRWDGVLIYSRLPLSPSW